jgi:phosphonate transport system substrate-binding protein
MLPSNGTPIANWERPDDAYSDIAKELKKVLQELQLKDSQIASSLSRRQWITGMVATGIVGAGIGIAGTLGYSYLNALKEVRLLIVHGSGSTIFDPISLKPALEKTLELPVHIKLADSYIDAIDSFVAKDYNVLWGSDLAYIIIAKRLGDQNRPIPILQIKNSTAESVSYYSHILTKRSSNINTIKDLRGKTFAVVNKYSTSGYLYPILEIYRNRLTVRDLQIRETGHHADSLDHILGGSVDAGAVSSTYYKSLASVHPDEVYISPIYAEALKKHQLSDNDVISIKKLGPLPSAPIVVQAHLLESDIWRLQKAFLLIDETTMGSVGISGFTPVTDSTYDSVRRTAREARKMGIDVEEV